MVLFLLENLRHPTNHQDLDQAGMCTPHSPFKFSFLQAFCFSPSIPFANLYRLPRQQPRWVPSSTSKSFRRRSSRMSLPSSSEFAAGKYVKPQQTHAQDFSPLWTAVNLLSISCSLACPKQSISGFLCGIFQDSTIG